MLDRILVPLDGSPLTECVLPHAIAIAKAFNAEVTLVHILDHPTAPLQFPKADPLDWYLKKSEAQLYLNTIQARLEAYQLSVQTSMIEGNIADRIVELAHSMQADLIILSSFGEAKFANGGGVSSVVQHILQRVRTSTLLIRTTEPFTLITDDMCYHKLMIPLDGSQRAGAVLSMATALAEAYESQVLLVHVVSKPEMARHMPLTPEDAELVNRLVERNQDEGKKYLEQVQNLLPIQLETRLLVSDNVAATLQNVSEDEQIDLLVLSAHGYSGESRWPYGSITNRFITSGTTPLLIVQDLQWATSSDSVRVTSEIRLPARVNSVA